MASPALNPDLPGARLRFDRFELDEAEARLARAGEPVAACAEAVRRPLRAARKPDKLVTKNELLDGVWGHRYVTESVLKSAISDVRAALGDDPKQPRYIETVSRRGYRFIAVPLDASSQGPAAIERNGAGGPGHAALAVLTTLCRCDAALADLISAVATTLERERLVLNHS